MSQPDPNENDQVDLDRLHAAVKREKPDIQPNREPYPMWVNLCVWAVLILSGGYLGAYTHVGGFDFNKSNPFPNKPEDPRGLVIDNAAALDPFQAAMKKGSTVFITCGGCHGTTGLGNPGTGIPPLAGSDWVTGGTERTGRIVINGLIGPITVSGANFNNPSGMPPHGAMFNDTELAGVLTYIRNSWGNKGTMVTKEMMAKVRGATKDHVGQWKPDDLKEFAEKNIEGPIPAGPGAPAAAPAAGAPAAPAAPAK